MKVTSTYLLVQARNPFRGEICLAGMMNFTLACLMMICYFDEKLSPLNLDMWLSWFYLLVCINLFCRFAVSSAASVILMVVYLVRIFFDSCVRFSIAWGTET